MTERPIIFSAPMVRAILAGAKTQTRQVAPIASFAIKPCRNNVVTWCVNFTRPLKGVLASHSGGKFSEDQVRRIIASQFCPNGKPGDRLWVRETWSEVLRAQPLTDEDAPCRADGRIIVYAADPEWDGARQFACADGVLRWAKPERWRPSIHMPRWASRILLEITGVRVERLQDISAEDAKAEGVECWRNTETLKGLTACCEHFYAFEDLWKHINGPGSWDANPWVWVIEFRRVEP